MSKGKSLYFKLKISSWYFSWYCQFVTMINIHWKVSLWCILVLSSRGDNIDIVQTFCLLPRDYIWAFCRFNLFIKYTLFASFRYWICFYSFAIIIIIILSELVLLVHKLWNIIELLKICMMWCAFLGNTLPMQPEEEDHWITLTALQEILGMR